MVISFSNPTVYSGILSPVTIKRLELIDGTYNITLYLFKDGCEKYTTEIEIEVCSCTATFSLNIDCTSESTALRWTIGLYDVEYRMASTGETLLKEFLTIR